MNGNLFARMATATLLAPVCVVLVLLLPARGFDLALLLVCLCGLFEWGRLGGASRMHFYLAAAVLTLAALGLSFSPRWLFVPVVGGCIFWFAQIFLLLRADTRRKANHPRLQLCLGVCVLLFAWAALAWLRRQPDGHLQVLVVLMTVWGVDSFAYLTGRAFGKLKLAPTMSPGKTVEGLFGGLLGGVAVGASLAFLLLGLSHDALVAWSLACLFAAAAAVLGDLYESALKRKAGRKDSGDLLPGHGGLLDRIDALLAAAPVFVFVWRGLA